MDMRIKADPKDGHWYPYPEYLPDKESEYLVIDEEDSVYIACHFKSDPSLTKPQGKRWWGLKALSRDNVIGCTRIEIQYWAPIPKRPKDSK